MRPEGIKYHKNQVILDVIERVNLLVNSQGDVVHSEILGALNMKCYLSGNPELRLGLNDKVMMTRTGRSTHATRFASCAPLTPILSRANYRSGGCRIPPMCTVVRKRPLHLFYSSRWRI